MWYNGTILNQIVDRSGAINALRPEYSLQGGYTVTKHTTSQPPNPSGLCQCGCGQPAPIASRSDSRKGWVMGQPVRFIAGHYAHVIHGDAVVRFWQLVDKRGPNECWEWQGVKDKGGYGKFQYGVMSRSHRVSYLLAYGALPDGMCVCHACDNPACCNPVHLWLGTNTDNIHDSVRKGRRGFGQTLPQAKLTESDVRRIRVLLAEGKKKTELGRLFGVHSSTIARACNGHDWKHVT